MRGFLARRWFAVAFSLGMLAVLLPLCQSRVLPFQDYSGIVGLSGALAHLDDPAARIRDFYTVDIGPYPCATYFGWALLLGKLGISVEVAYSLFIALFAVAGPPLATLLLLRAFGRPPHLALLAFAISYHHQIWFGFVGSAGAITGLVLSLAFAKRVADHGRLADHAGLAAAVLFVALGHPFSLAFTLVLVAPLLVWPPAPVQDAGARRWLRLARVFALRVACLLPTLLFLRAWARSFFAGNAGGLPLYVRIWREVRLTLPSPVRDAAAFLRWLGDGYATGWDELVPGLALLTLALFLAWGVRGEPGPPAPAPRRYGWIWLAWAALALALGYLLLPMTVMWPQPWWGVRVRCVAPLFLVLLAVPRPRPRGLPAWALAPAAVAALIFAGYLSYDFRANFRGGELSGFDEAVAAIPPGRTVLGFPAADLHHRLAHPYLVQHYVARKGGSAVPHLRGHPGAYWITMHEPPPAPSWGNPDLFVWEEHASYDYFLLQLPPDGPTPEPFARAPAGAVELVLARGHWVLYRNLMR
jgi:hypothetical protein